MMRNRYLRSGLVVFSLAVSVPALAADPTGDWLVEKGVAKIRVAECNGALWGAVSWEKTPGGRDTNNPDASKRDRPTLGMVTLLNFKKKPGVEEWEGQAYDAQTTGGKFDTTLRPIGADRLEIKGCFLMFCDGQTWTRVSGPILPSGAKGQASARRAPTTIGVNASPAPTQPGDIGNVCLLPEVARFAHQRRLEQ